MKKQFFFSILFIGLACFANGQVCIKPTPLTADQVQKVAGKWKGSYTNNGAQVDIEINIAAKSNYEVTCEVNNPPLSGKETMVEYFFCPGGEFHMRKYVGDVSYVFQATPENGQMKGIVSIYDSKNKRKQAGNFVISKSE